jgi:hypothetical protein
VGTVGFIVGGVGLTVGTFTTGGATGTDGTTGSETPGVAGFVAGRVGGVSTGGKTIGTVGAPGCVEGNPLGGVETIAG